MLYIKIEPQSCLSSGEKERFEASSQSKSMASSLFNSAQPLGQIVSTLSTEGSCEIWAILLK